MMERICNGRFTSSSTPVIVASASARAALTANGLMGVSSRMRVCTERVSVGSTRSAKRLLASRSRVVMSRWLLVRTAVSHTGQMWRAKMGGCCRQRSARAKKSAPVMPTTPGARVSMTVACGTAVCSSFNAKDKKEGSAVRISEGVMGSNVVRGASFYPRTMHHAPRYYGSLWSSGAKCSVRFW